MITYGEALNRLLALGRLGIRPGREATRAALLQFGSPERRFPALHVAGTNGKGSTAAMAAAMLRAAGARVGLYTSPHLLRYTERIRVDGVEIAEDRVAAIAERVLDAAPGLTFFEATTVIGFIAFAESNVDIAVIEVGLGGRLDATSLCRPAACVITGIALDHTELLGDTEAAIAGEKAGILKPGVPAVVGPVSDEARAVIEARAREVGAPAAWWDKGDVSAWRDGELLSYRGPGGPLDGAPLALAGAHQARNAALALAATALLPEALRPDERARRAGLAEVRWPGRLERVAPDLWLDAAHNPDGARALAAALGALGPEWGVRPVLLVGVLGDKDAAGVLDALAPVAGSIVCTTPASPRALPARDLAALAARHAPALAVDDVGDALAAARACARGAPVVVCGSVFLVGAVRRLVSGERGDPTPVSDPGASRR